MPSKMQQVRVPLPAKQIAELAELATKQGISQAELIRETLIQAGVISAIDIRHGGSRLEAIMAQADKLTDFGRNDPTE